MLLRPAFAFLALLSLLSPASGESLNVKGEEITAEKLATQFRAVVFKTESGQSKKLVRWASPITVRMTGDGSDAFKPDVEKILKALADRTRLPVRLANDNESANLMIRFQPTAEIKKKFGNGFNCAGRFEGQAGTITRGEVYLPTDNDRTRHCIAEEITQIFGLPNDTKIIRNSLFNDDTPPTQVTLTIPDSILLATLYDKRIRANTTEAEAMPMVEKVLGEQLDNVIRQLKARKNP